jgi:hypothetical protein
VIQRRDIEVDGKLEIWVIRWRELDLLRLPKRSEFSRTELGLQSSRLGHLDKLEAGLQFIQSDMGLLLGIRVKRRVVLTRTSVNRRNSFARIFVRRRIAFVRIRIRRWGIFVRIKIARREYAGIGIERRVILIIWGVCIVPCEGEMGWKEVFFHSVTSRRRRTKAILVSLLVFVARGGRGVSLFKLRSIHRTGKLGQFWGRLTSLNMLEKLFHEYHLNRVHILI